jgi:ABC-type nitrate/sulfonate/bicarbonate transport system permease component
MENTLTGLRQVDAQRLQLFRMLGATRVQTLLRLKLPTGLPAILAGLRVAVVLALVGAVVAEFMGASQGLGAVVIAAQGMMDTTLMFAALVLIAAMGLLLYQACLFWSAACCAPITFNLAVGRPGLTASSNHLSCTTATRLRSSLAAACSAPVQA